MRIKNVLIAMCFFTISCVLVVLIELGGDTFYLEDKYYGTTKIDEIDNFTLKRLMSQEESFILFVYQPLCVNSTNFEALLSNFQNDYEVGMKKIKFSNLKNTPLEDEIKYYPSFVIFKDGKVVDYLDANSDKDTDRFKKEDTFVEWLTKYVKIGKTKKNTETTTTTKKVNTDVVVDLPDVKKEEGKVNIYLFWGSGCPHCANEKEYLKSIESKYGDKYNLYLFEVFNDKQNQEIMNKFALEMGDKIDGGVPYTIIGSKSFRGFSESSEDKLLEAIKEQSKTDTDIYIDVIKDKYNKK